MSDVAEAPVETGTAIALVVSQTPAIVLTDKQSRTEFYAHIQAEVDAFEPDVTTNKGREAIASLAYKITRTKTAIDAAGKELNEEARLKINAVDAERRAAREHLTELAAKVRKPLTDWEEAEKVREAEVERILALFRSERIVQMGEKAATIRDRGTAIHKTAIDPAVFGDRADEGEREKKETVDILLAAMATAEKAEAEAAELQRLRLETAEREAAERARQEAEVAEQRRIEAERQAEADRVAAEQAEAERVARAEQEAADRARREAEEAAQRERDEIARKHEEALAAERERTAAAEREAQAERDRIAREEQERVDAAAREAAEAAERQTNKENRTARKTAAKEAIIATGIPEAKAIKLVQAIVAGDIPNVRMEF